MSTSSVVWQSNPESRQRNQRPVRRGLGQHDEFPVPPMRSEPPPRVEHDIRAGIPGTVGHTYDISVVQQIADRDRPAEQRPAAEMHGPPRPPRGMRSPRRHSGLQKRRAGHHHRRSNASRKRHTDRNMRKRKIGPVRAGLRRGGQPKRPNPGVRGPFSEMPDADPEMPKSRRRPGGDGHAPTVAAPDEPTVITIPAPRELVYALVPASPGPA